MHSIIYALAFLLALATASAAEPIIGRASVMDGDTLDIGGTRIRLHGIDAPENGQLCQNRAGKAFRCGQAGPLALADRIGSTPVSCDPRDTDKYGRTVAVCRKGAEDLNRWLVAQGHAVAYRHYSQDYVPAEDNAKAGKLGIWAGSFTAPGDWRKGERAMTMGSAAPGGSDGPIPTPTPPQPASKAGGCAIKGNISRKGEKVFHVPGSRDYDWTRISERDGERVFCTEDEAKAAGWRAPRR
ncbi:thermonuclease family protein [Methylobacterium sp. E-045]|uniref:thermonuclease family protein n=1 Tax=Methylobacterium sp. E-045 TaxID=2836575 RepID=UPI001FBB0440|nr:thermonuclease family protein [Methylobacterium sp. E-045]MCJ2129258.1 thermonuclease family protein [Methylobacterium sp. E-045]